ncbi:MAG: hypothetical protein F6K42_31185 [Leptolyngbya sp. SIO1D8]|nr:hypothetical protein [Leptolyngbya sp. SIO1D8]
MTDKTCCIGRENRTPTLFECFIPILRVVVTDVEAESIVMSTFFNPKSKIQNRKLVLGGRSPDPMQPMDHTTFVSQSAKTLNLRK